MSGKADEQSAAPRRPMNACYWCDVIAFPEVIYCPKCGNLMQPFPMKGQSR